jgi:hypothetical protein
MAIGNQAKAMMLSDATAKTAQRAILSMNSTVNNSYNLNAHYRHQGEQSLRDDIVMLSMMKGRK